MIIHEILEIEEKAIIKRIEKILTWPKEPIIADSTVEKITKEKEKLNIKIYNGANFCQVIRIILLDQEDILEIIGNQEWNGAAPILRSINNLKININILYISKDIIIFIIKLISKRIADILWTKKYFIVLSLEKKFFLSDKT